MFDRTDRYVGIGFIVLGILGTLSAMSWPTMFSTDPAGPAAIPIILCVSLIILGAVLAVGGFLVKKKAAEPFIQKRDVILVAELTGTCLLYIILLQVIGYLLATPLLLAAILLIVGTRKWKTIIMVSLITTVVLFLLFYSLLQVNLPLGFMRDFIRSFVPRI